MKYITENQIKLAEGMGVMQNVRVEKVLKVDERVQKVQETFDALNEKKSIKHKPAILRSALDLEIAMGVFSMWKNSDELGLRSIIAVITQKGLGCRIGEISFVYLETI